MEVKQFKGPFYTGGTITSEARYDYEIVHMGIQIPRRQPISSYTKYAYPPDLEINGMGFAVNENGILEFDGMAEVEFTVKFLKNLPPETLIDIVYKAVEE